MNKFFVYDGPDFLKGFETEKEADEYAAEQSDIDNGLGYYYVVELEEHREIQDNNKYHDDKFGLYGEYLEDY